MSKLTLDASKYWENQLTADPSLRATGNRAFSLEYNQILYQAQGDCLTALLNKWKVNLARKQVLDVSSGAGFFVDYYLKRGAGNIQGMDTSETNVKYLKERYPDCDFTLEDISKPTSDYLGNFDLISAIGVLYNFIDDYLFEQALQNLCSMCQPGGYLLISDAFEGRWLPGTQHVHLRTLEQYQPHLENFEVLELAPIYYFLNRVYIPIVGPWLINLLKLGRMFYRLDGNLRERGVRNGKGQKIMLAQRMF